VRSTPLFFSTVRLLLARERSLLRVAEEGLEGIRRPPLSRGSAILPLWGEWPRRCPLPFATFVLVYFFFPPLLLLYMRGFWGQRCGQEVIRAERAEREERPARMTSCP
jgi:hypothetical protein